MTEQATRSKIYSVAAFLFAFLFLFAFALALIPEATAQFSNFDNGAHLLITEIYPDTATRNELDEYVALTNPSARSVNIDGWRLTDNEETIIFPTFEVGSNQTVYVTRTASAFLTQQSSVKREDGGESEEATSEAERDGKTPTKLKLVGVAVTLILTVVIFRIVKWYKRL